jgi:hypothetical protein
MYYVEKERIYAYYRDSEEKVFADYCFVKPINRSEEGFQYSTRVEKELVGTVALIGQGAIEQGIAIGDTIAFRPDSEYEFRIDDVKHYRIPVLKHIRSIMSSKKTREDIIKAGEIAVKELIRVAKEEIITGNPESELSADRLKNAAATKKLAMFDAFDILNRIEDERNTLDNVTPDKKDDSKKGFAEKFSK